MGNNELHMLRRIVTMTDEERDHMTRREIERRRLKVLVVVLVVVTAMVGLVTYGPSDAEIEGGTRDLDVQLVSGDDA